MRILVIHPGPTFSVNDVFAGWVEALRKLGQQVYTYHLNDRLAFFNNALNMTDPDEGPFPDDATEKRTVKRALTRDQALWAAANGLYGTCYQIWPDVVIGISAFYTPPLILEVMRARKHKVVLVHTESPYQDDEQLQRAAHADYNILNDPTGLQRFRDLGAPADYYPHAYRPAVHHPGLSVPEKVCDLAFIGTAFSSRIKFFEGMDLDGLDVMLAGNWMKLPEESPGSPLNKYIATEGFFEGVENTETADVYRSARMGINFYRREVHYNGGGDAEHAYAIGPREVEMAACGLPFLRDPGPEGDELFPFLPTFTSPEEASEKLRWALARPQWRDKVRADAYAAIQDRTFENNAKRLLTKLEGL